MSLQTPPSTTPSLGVLTPKEQFTRALNLCSYSDTVLPRCIKEITIGIFFDGTSNNLERDTKSNSHSNIVALY